MRGGDKARSVVRVRASQLTKREHLQTFVSIANISDEEYIVCEEHPMTGQTWQH